MKFRSVGFYGGRKTGEPGGKPLEQGEVQQQTHEPHETLRTGIEPGSQRWDGSSYPIWQPCSPKRQLNNGLPPRTSEIPLERSAKKFELTELENNNAKMETVNPGVVTLICEGKMAPGDDEEEKMESALLDESYESAL